MECANCKAEITKNPHTRWEHGHNGVPLVEGRVCDECNVLVILKRLADAKASWGKT